MVDMRTPKILIVVVAAILAGLVLAAIGVDKLQRVQDDKTLRSFVAQEQKLKSLHAGTSNLALCTLGSTTGKCPSIQYKISEDECLQLLREFTLTNENKCSAREEVTYNGRTIRLSFGQIYEREGLYVQVSMQEKNLLWSF